jgi:hypothetical protein
MLAAELPALLMSAFFFAPLCFSPGSRRIVISGRGNAPLPFKLRGDAAMDGCDE